MVSLAVLGVVIAFVNVSVVVVRTVVVVGGIAGIFKMGVAAVNFLHVVNRANVDVSIC